MVVPPANLIVVDARRLAVQVAQRHQTRVELVVLDGPAVDRRAAAATWQRRRTGLPTAHSLARRSVRL